MRKEPILIGLPLFWAIELSAFCLASDIYVPADYPTIQQAIDAAAPGDQILVSPGTYVENIDYKGKRIAVRSLGGPDVTVIDGSSLGTVVTFQGAEGRKTVLDGFSIAHGQAERGGGVHCAGASSPTIIHNRFVQNDATNEGGGLFASDGSPLVLMNSFELNSATQYGGGVSFHCDSVSSAMVMKCTFYRNEAYFNAGAIELCDASGVSVIDCTFTENYAMLGYGGAIRCDASNSILKRNRFFNNTSGWRGGAVYCCFSWPEIEDSIFVGNRAKVCGGALECEDASAVVRNCVFLENESGDSGGAMCAIFGGALVVNCTFHGNACLVAGGAGGAVFGIQADYVLQNCVLWDDHAQVGPEIYITSGVLSVSYCDVEGGWPGTGNIDLDPMFADPDAGDLSLLPDSPCIDVGSLDLVSDDRDLVSNPRILDGNLDRSMQVDMGAFEFSNLSWILEGAASPGNTVTIETKGKPGLVVVFCAGLAAGRTCLDPLGLLFIDLSQPWVAIPLGVIPASGFLDVDVTIPAGLPVPITLVCQEVGLYPPTSAGNTSNDVLVTIDS